MGDEAVRQRAGVGDAESAQFRPAAQDGLDDAFLPVVVVAVAAQRGGRGGLLSRQVGDEAGLSRSPRPQHEYDQGSPARASAGRTPATRSPSRHPLAGRGGASPESPPGAGGRDQHCARSDCDHCSGTGSDGEPSRSPWVLSTAGPSADA